MEDLERHWDFSGTPASDVKPFSWRREDLLPSWEAGIERQIWEGLSDFRRGGFTLAVVSTQCYADLTVMDDGGFHLNSIKACRAETPVTEPSALWPFLSRHLQDWMMFGKLTASKEERLEGRGIQVGVAASVVCRACSEEGKGILQEEGRVENNGRISCSLKNSTPLFDFPSSLTGESHENSTCFYV